MNTPKIYLALCLALALMACAAETEDTDSSNNVSLDQSSTKNEDKGDLIVNWEPSENFPNTESFLKETEIFENIADSFNSFAIFPNDINIFHGECGQANAFYVPQEKAILMCYEMFNFVANTFYNAPYELTDEEITQVTFQTWLFIFFHELGHALVDNYNLPITGREEDAVDDFSTILLIESDLGEAAVNASIFWSLIEDGQSSDVEFADEHSLNAQRFYNIMCTVYGSDKTRFDYIPSFFPEMSDRLDRCENEFNQKKNAWNTLLEPWSKN